MKHPKHSLSKSQTPKTLLAVVAVFFPLLFSGCAEMSNATDQAPAEMENPEPTSPSQQPNIIFVLVDDQRFDAIGALNPLLKTPNMDRMMREGVYFRNAFVGTSLCSPSRATILTGKSTRNHKVTGNSEPEAEGTIFFPTYLQEVGYETALIGKWHMGHTAQKRDGFDFWLSFEGQGNYTPDQARSEKSVFNINGAEVEQQGYITDELTDYAIDWIQTKRDASKPFFIHLAHKAVHANFTPPQRYLDQYEGVVFPEPASMENTEENYLNKPRWLKTQRNSWHGVDFSYYSKLDLQETQRRYYASLSAVDDSLGRLIEMLEQEDLAEDTLIILMGDNGFMFGEFGLIDKRVAYEPSIRVPLVAYWPGNTPEGSIVEELVSNHDIAPTLVALGGATAPDYFEGDDFSELLKTGSSGEWDNEFVYEYYWDQTQPHTPTTFSIRTDAFKYIYYHGVWDVDELYDIANDPGETKNLALDPEYAEIKSQYRARLFAVLQDGDGDRVIPFEVPGPRFTPFRNVNGSEVGEFPEDFFRVPFEDNTASDLNPPRP